MIFFKMQQNGFVGLLMLVSTFSLTANTLNDTNKHKKEFSSQARQPEFDEAEFYQALIAEFYQQFDKPKLTLKHYLPIALKSNDPVLLKRVTEIATGSAQLKKGLKAARHWVELSPESLEAQQYYALLLLRDGQLNESAKQLHFIRKIVDRDAKKDEKHRLVSKGLKFIGALLVIESHHDKAFRVYSDYLSQLKTTSSFKDQKKLILASLGMKAKAYAVVVSALSDIEIKGSEYFTSAAIMKTKALRKLGRIDEAAALLQQIVSTKKTSDSLRLKLTRLLIGVGKHAEAEVELKKLVKKHPDNNDLLKALIGLNVTLKEWQQAKDNNTQLSKNKAYQNDVDYFNGEIYEGEGNLKSALLSYKKVVGGVFLNKSHSKTARLLAQVRGINASRQWLKEKQKAAVKVKDKSYWMTLEADLLSDRRLSFGLSTRQQNLRDAITLYDQVITLSPKKLSYRYHRGLLLERTGQVDRAERDFNTVIEKTKKPAKALNALGFLLVTHTDRLDEAKMHIEKALKLKPNDALIMDSLGWVYYRTGDIKKAESYLRKAFSRLKTPEVASHFITVLSETKKHQEARKIFNAMIKKYPNSASLDDVRNNLEHI